MRALVLSVLLFSTPALAGPVDTLDKGIALVQSGEPAKGLKRLDKAVGRLDALPEARRSEALFALAEVHMRLAMPLRVRSMSSPDMATVVELSSEVAEHIEVTIELLRRVQARDDLTWKARADEVLGMAGSALMEAAVEAHGLAQRRGAPGMEAITLRYATLATEATPDDPVAWFVLAGLSSEQGRQQHALEANTTGLARYDSHPGPEVALVAVVASIKQVDLLRSSGRPEAEQREAVEAGFERLRRAERSGWNLPRAGIEELSRELQSRSRQVSGGSETPAFVLDEEGLEGEELRAAREQVTRMNDQARDIAAPRAAESGKEDAARAAQRDALVFARQGDWFRAEQSAQFAVDVGGEAGEAAVPILGIAIEEQATHLMGGLDEARYPDGLRRNVAGKDAEARPLLERAWEAEDPIFSKLRIARALYRIARRTKDEAAQVLWAERIEALGGELPEQGR